MLKATVGTWLNYATTVIFQVLFAARFGSTAAASTYALTFTIAVALGAIFVGTTQSIYIPRLLSQDGEVLSAGIRRILWLTLLALVVFVAFAAGASPFAAALGGKLNRPGTHLVAVMRFAALFGFSQVLVGQLAAVCWARGSRFVPAVAPAIPSLVASVPLVVNHEVTAQTLYLLLTVGTLGQLVLLAVTGCRRLRVGAHTLAGTGRLTIAFLGAYLLAQFILPFEIFVAARGSASGGADFNYAYRALAVAQLLIVGGLTLGALPEWSGYARAQARQALERSIVRAGAVAALALSLAGAVGLVTSTSLVRLAFQHGSFTPHDTLMVSMIVRAALIGFVAEGMILVLSPALVADRRNRAAIAFGVARTGCVVVLVAAFGLAAGPVGVAVGYSAANATVLGGQLVYLYQAGMVTRRESPMVRATAVVIASTGAAAAVGLLLPVPAPVRPGIVIAVFVIVAAAVRNTLPRPPKIQLSRSSRRRLEPPQTDSVAARPPMTEQAAQEVALVAKTRD